MRPGWLEVPAADPHERSGSFAAARLLIFTADRRRLRVGEPVPSWRPWLQEAPTADGAGSAEIGLAMPETLSQEILHLGGSGQCSASSPTAHLRLGAGRADPRCGPALDIHQVDVALSAGRHAVERARLAGIDLVAVRGQDAEGHTATLALACAAMGEDADAVWIGDLAQGATAEATGAAPDMVAVRTALDRHAGHLEDPYEVLRRLGGFEHAALVGTCVACAQIGVPLWPLGYAAEVAVLVACRIHPGIAPWLTDGEWPAKGIPFLLAGGRSSLRPMEVSSR